MSLKQKSNLPLLIPQVRTIPQYNKTHMIFLVSSILMLSAVLIASSY